MLLYARSRGGCAREVGPEKCKRARNLYSLDDLILISSAASSSIRARMTLFNIHDSEVNGIMADARNSFAKIESRNEREGRLQNGSS